MASSTKRNLTLVATLILAGVAISWAVGQYQTMQPNETVDNGVHSTIPGPPPEAAKAMKKMMDARLASGQPMPLRPPDPNVLDSNQAKAAMSEVLTAEEQQAMRDGMQHMMQERQKIRQALGPEEARAFEKKMGTRIRQMMDRERQSVQAQQ